MYIYIWCVKLNIHIIFIKKNTSIIYIAFDIFACQLSSVHVKPEANILWTADGEKKARSCRSTSVALTAPSFRCFRLVVWLVLSDEILKS